MFKEFISNDWVQALALLLTIVTGIWFLWEKIPADKKWQFKNALARFKKTPPNPFNDQGRITDSDRFFEQEQLLNKVFDELNKGTNLSLIGAEKTGKSSLLYHIFQKAPDSIYLDMQIVHDEGDFFKALCSEIGIEECRGFELQRALRDKRYVLCLDNIGRMTNKLFSGDERLELRGLAEDGRLTLLIASHFPLADLFPDSPLEASPLAGICQIIDMPPFSQQEVRTFIKTRLRSTGIDFTDAEIETIWQDSQGHPAGVQELAKVLYNDKDCL
ncbi:MAG: hypothetical protein VSS75_031560 [Candidatus Parabeggiatoa sp.]|nr:hypothetical protein [Candidatus Parabeggiatoa sp.]